MSRASASRQSHVAGMVAMISAAPARLRAGGRGGDEVEIDDDPGFDLARPDHLTPDPARHLRREGGQRRQRARHQHQRAARPPGQVLGDVQGQAAAEADHDLRSGGAGLPQPGLLRLDEAVEGQRLERLRDEPPDRCRQRPRAAGRLPRGRRGDAEVGAELRQHVGGPGVLTLPSICGDPTGRGKKPHAAPGRCRKPPGGGGYGGRPWPWSSPPGPISGISKLLLLLHIVTVVAAFAPLFVQPVLVRQLGASVGGHPRCHGEPPPQQPAHPCAVADPGRVLRHPAHRRLERRVEVQPGLGVDGLPVWIAMNGVLHGVQLPPSAS